MESPKVLSIVTAILVAGLILILGKAYFDRADPTGQARPNSTMAGSTAREADPPKRQLPQSVDLSVLTQAFDYKPPQRQKTACAMEYENLALLSSEELMRSVIEQKAQISDACQEALQSRYGRERAAVEEILAACHGGIHASSCLTPVIGLKTQLIDVGTEHIDAQDLPDHVLLSRIYARNAKSDQTVEDMQSILNLLDVLESRGAPAGLENLRISLLTDMAFKDEGYLDEFKAIAEKTEVENPEDALAYRYKYHWQKNEPEKIEGLVRVHLQTNPQSARAYYYLAIAAHEKGDMKSALALASKSVELNPSDTFVQKQVQILKQDPSQWKRQFMLPRVHYSFGR